LLYLLVLLMIFSNKLHFYLWLCVNVHTPCAVLCRHIAH
jgi:hypothetical protein